MKSFIHLIVASAVLFTGSLGAQAKKTPGKVKSTTSKSVQAKKQQKKPAVIDINKATVADLQSALKGVGPVKAKAIVAYRKKNGAFKTTDDLLKVPGVGVATVAINLASLKLPQGKVDLKAAAKSVKGANASGKKAKKKAVPAGSGKGSKAGTKRAGKTEKGTGKAKTGSKTEKPKKKGGK